MNLLRILGDSNSNSWGSWLMPPPASNLASDVDYAWNVILGVTTFFFAIIVVAMIVFLIKYRRRTPNDETSEITHNTPLEVLWTGIPLILVVMFFFVGFKGFLNYDTPPSNCRVVDVEGHRWGFIFTYENGATGSDLYLEKEVPYKLDLHSSDVLHAFYIPAFRTQRNLIFGRITNIWFIPNVLSPVSTGKGDPGGWSAFCTQYCGKDHSKMGARVYVLDKVDYDKKMTELANPFKETDSATGKSRYVPYTVLGEKLYKTSAGCIACHSIDGKDGTGPTWKGLWKSDVNYTSANGPGTLHKSDSDEAWEAYIRESAIHPDAKIVVGKQNVMPSYAPTFEGPPGSAKDEKMRAIIAYIRSVGDGYTPPADPKSDAYDADKHPVHPESLAATHPELIPKPK